ncbi:MAG: M3 family metallopeptidase [Burkholderiaceae bacterium]
MNEPIAPAVDNPLLDLTGFTAFRSVCPEHVEPALAHLLAQAERALAQSTADDTPPTWAAVAEPLDCATEQLGRAWGVIGHLHAVADTPELRAAYNLCLPKITEFWTRLGQDEKLYAKYKDIAASAEAQRFSPARQKVLDNALRDFRLGGAELPAADKPRYAEIQEKQAALSAKFSENVLDATNDYAYWVTDPAELAGLPEDSVSAAQEAAERHDAATRHGPYKFTLQFPSYFPVQQYADDRAFRETLYGASARRASEFGPAALDNGPLIVELLKLRQEEAQMLGFRHFADLSLVPKMAESPEQVLEFMRDLARRARPFAEKDLAELRTFAREHLQIETLAPWDLTYVSEKLRQHRYAFSDNEVKQYFPEPAVLDGLFGLANTLFGVSIAAARMDVWHDDVRFFEVRRHEQTIAHFYLDPYAREHKRGGAWMDDARGRKRLADQTVQTPIAYLTCNFPRPVSDKPATLTHDDVLTLFHEFGHGLHHMLTQVDELGVAGINGVEWDAVELPSQFMENFAWEWQVVEKLSTHVETGARLPRTLFDKMIAAKNFQSGLQTLRQVELALFDLLVHSGFAAESSADVMRLLNEVRAEISVLTPPAYQRLPHTFSHIFAGGYSAGYYSYKWAEVLSADAYGKFEENGIFDAATGQKFLDDILASGGSRPAAESFAAFRGRPPTMDALLRHCGMVDS